MAAAEGNEAELRQLIGRGESVNWHAPPYGTQCAVRRRKPRVGARVVAACILRPRPPRLRRHSAASTGARRRAYSNAIWSQLSTPTALMIGVASGHHGCVRILLDSGATVNVTNVSLKRPRWSPVAPLFATHLPHVHLSVAPRIHSPAYRGIRWQSRNRQAAPPTRRRPVAPKQVWHDGPRRCRHVESGGMPQRDGGPAQRASVRMMNQL
jgi:hypothetical protein